MKTAFGPCRVALGVVYAFVVGNAYGATLAPPNGAEQVCVDTHLAVTFDQAPQVGSAGTIRVLFPFPVTRTTRSSKLKFSNRAFASSETRSPLA